MDDRGGLLARARSAVQMLSNREASSEEVTTSHSTSTFSPLPPLDNYHTTGSPTTTSSNHPYPSRSSASSSPPPVVVPIFSVDSTEDDDHEYCLRQTQVDELQEQVTSLELENTDLRHDLEEDERLLLQLSKVITTTCKSEESQKIMAELNIRPNEILSSDSALELTMRNLQSQIESIEEDREKMYARVMALEHENEELQEGNLAKGLKIEALEKALQILEDERVASEQANKQLLQEATAALSSPSSQKRPLIRRSFSSAFTPVDIVPGQGHLVSMDVDGSVHSASSVTGGSMQSSEQQFMILEAKSLSPKKSSASLDGHFHYVTNKSSRNRRLGGGDDTSATMSSVSSFVSTPDAGEHETKRDGLIPSSTASAGSASAKKRPVHPIIPVSKMRFI